MVKWKEREIAVPKISEAIGVNELSQVKQNLKIN